MNQISELLQTCLYAPARFSCALPVVGRWGAELTSFDQLETQQLTRCGFSRERLEAGTSVIHALFDKRLYRSRIFLGGEQNPPVLRLDVGLELVVLVIRYSLEGSQPTFDSARPHPAHANT